MTSRVQLDTDYSTVILAAGCVRDSIERSDAFRVRTAENPEFGVRMNVTVEWGIRSYFPFLAHAQAMTLAHPDLNGEVSRRENQELFDKLCESRAKHRWADGGHWRGLCRDAESMGLTGAPEAMWAQEQDEKQPLPGKGAPL